MLLAAMGKSRFSSVPITVQKHQTKRRMVPRGLIFIIATLTSVAQGLSVRSSVSTTTQLSAGASWSEADLLTEKAKMSAELSENPPMPRTIRIEAELLDPISVDFENFEPLLESTTNDDTKKIVATKIVHFQRHGQGYHNLLGDVLRDAGIKPDIFSSDTAINPWVRPEIVDSPLTEKGKRQCEGQQKVAALLKPQIVVVSPLLRAIQTSKLSFQEYESTVPWIAHEGCREETGFLVCNKRRKLSEIKADYPDLQFADPNITEEDTLFDPTQFESEAKKGERIYDFLTNFLMDRSEGNIAVVCHSAWLSHMCNEVLDCGDDNRLTSWFDVSEIRSMKLTFIETSDA